MRFLISGTAVALLAVAAVTPALADDAPGGTLVPGMQLAQMPPPPMMGLYNWSGLYAGINFGGGFGDEAVRLSGDPVATQPAINRGQVPSRLATSPDGFLGGGQFGYNWQSGRFVLGGEADFDGGTINRNQRITTNIGGGFFPTTTAAKQQLTSLGTARARLGYAITDSLLLYGTGGLGFGSARLATSITTLPNCIGACLAGNVSGFKTGWVGGAGLEWGWTPSVSVKAEYLRYDLGRLTQTFGDIRGMFPGTTATQRANFDGNIVRVGVNWHFNAPPPPPAPAAMPAPPPAAPKVFIVFFDWDRDSITNEGRQIIAQAADAYKSGAPVQIQVTGYTDRSGSAGYNQRLSERRANNVAKALAALGVPPAQMVVSGRGENDNRVPTANGVREPQNRRVEIVFP